MNFTNIIFIFLVTALTSCRTTVTYNSLSNLQKGMSINAVENNLSPFIKFDYKQEYKLNSNGKNYIVHIVPFSIGQEYSDEKWAELHIQLQLVSNPFYLLYQDNKLRYWGITNEFTRSEDSEIQAIAKNLPKARQTDLFRYFNNN